MWHFHQIISNTQTMERCQVQLSNFTYHIDCFHVIMFLKPILILFMVLQYITRVTKWGPHHLVFLLIIAKSIIGPLNCLVDPVSALYLFLCQPWFSHQVAFLKHLADVSLAIVYGPQFQCANIRATGLQLSGVVATVLIAFKYIALFLFHNIIILFTSHLIP